MSFFVHVGDKNKNISILGAGLDDPTLTAEAKYSIFTQSTGNICLSIFFNRGNSFKATKINHFKWKHSEIKKILFLGNMLVDFLAFKMIKTELNGSVYDFSVNSNIIDSSNIIDIHKYL